MTIESAIIGSAIFVGGLIVSQLISKFMTKGWKAEEQAFNEIKQGVQQINDKLDNALSDIKVHESNHKRHDERLKGLEDGLNNLKDKILADTTKLFADVLSHLKNK